MNPPNTSMVLSSSINTFRFMKNLGDRTLEQLAEAELNWQPDAETNSVAILVKHLHGNMHSRWTDVLTTDGEKKTRKRDEEFLLSEAAEKPVVLGWWAEGWSCVFAALEELSDDDLARTVIIRNEELLVIDAIQRQVFHYGYHVGQMVQLGKMIRKQEWKTLSIPRGESNTYTRVNWKND